MTALNKQALREAAEKATSGEWERGDGNGGELLVYCDDALGSAVCEMTSEYNSIPKYQRINNLNFIAAANPDTVLALLSELEAAEQDSARWFKAFEKAVSVGARYEERIAELEASPANPINFKESADADYCRDWAWNEVKKELSPEDWAAGDNFTYYGFFCWGWDSRRQFNEQRAAGVKVGG